MLWTTNKASVEFGVDRQTLARRLHEMGLEVPVGKAARKAWLTTRQCTEAVFGSLDKEKTRLASANAEAREMENRIARGELVTVESMREYIRDHYGPLRERLLAAPVQLAQRCNPADPPHAHAVIVEWVDDILRLGRGDKLISAVVKPKPGAK